MPFCQLAVNLLLMYSTLIGVGKRCRWEFTFVNKKTNSLSPWTPKCLHTLGLLYIRYKGNARSIWTCVQVTPTCISKFNVKLRNGKATRIHAWKNNISGANVLIPARLELLSLSGSCEVTPHEHARCFNPTAEVYVTYILVFTVIANGNWLYIPLWSHQTRVSILVKDCSRRGSALHTIGHHGHMIAFQSDCVVDVAAQFDWLQTV